GEFYGAAAKKSAGRSRERPALFFFVSDARPSLLQVGPRLAVLVVERDLGDFQQVQVLPSDAVTLLVDDLEVPQLRLLLAGVVYVHALAARQRVLAEDGLLPVVAAVRGDVKLVNLHARIVVQGEVLFALGEGRGGEQRRKRAGRGEHCQPAETVILYVSHAWVITPLIVLPKRPRAARLYYSVTAVALPSL